MNEWAKLFVVDSSEASNLIALVTANIRDTKWNNEKPAEDDFLISTDRRH